MSSIPNNHKRKKIKYIKKHRKTEQLGNTNTPHTTDTKNITDLISEEAIDKIIDDLLLDPDINIYGFPDALERKLYKKLFIILLGLINKAVMNTNINVLGHTITLQLNKK